MALLQCVDQSIYGLGGMGEKLGPREGVLISGRRHAESERDVGPRAHLSAEIRRRTHAGMQVLDNLALRRVDAPSGTQGPDLRERMLRSNAPCNRSLNTCTLTANVRAMTPSPQRSRSGARRAEVDRGLETWGFGEIGCENRTHDAQSDDPERPSEAAQAIGRLEDVAVAVGRLEAATEALRGARKVAHLRCRAMMPAACAQALAQLFGDCGGHGGPLMIYFDSKMVQGRVPCAPGARGRVAQGSSATADRIRMVGSARRWPATEAISNCRVNRTRPWGAPGQRRRRPMRGGRELGLEQAWAQVPQETARAKEKLETQPMRPASSPKDSTTTFSPAVCSAGAMSRAVRPRRCAWRQDRLEASRAKHRASGAGCAMLPPTTCAVVQIGEGVPKHL